MMEKIADAKIAYLCLDICASEMNAKLIRSITCIYLALLSWILQSNT